MAASDRPLEGQMAVVTAAAIGTRQVHAVGLAAMGIGHLRVMGASEGDLRAGGQMEHAAEALHPLLARPPITDGGHHKARGQAALSGGPADPVSSGVKLLANLDLVERLRHDAALDPPEPATKPGEGPHGSTGFPRLAA